jgi:hypothetical protein
VPRPPRASEYLIGTAVLTVLSGGILYALFHRAISQWSLGKQVAAAGGLVLGDFFVTWVMLMRAHGRAVARFVDAHDPLADLPADEADGVAVWWEVTASGARTVGWLSLENRRNEPLVVDGLGGGGARGLSGQIVDDEMSALPDLPEVAAQTLVPVRARVRVEVDLTPMLGSLSGAYRLRFTWTHALGRSSPHSFFLGDAVVLLPPRAD